MKRENLKFDSIIIFIIFFLQTMSFVMTLNLNNIKYISIFMLNGLVVINCLKRGIKRREFILCLILFITLFTTCAFQNTSFSGKISSIVFYITFLIWTLLSYKVINKKKHILCIIIGIATAVILGLLLTFNEVVVQLASIYNSRNRLWGGFTHPNNLGGITSCVIIGLYAYKFIGGIKEKNKKYYYLFIFIFIFILYATKSRTSWIVTIVAIIVMNIKFIECKQKSVRIMLYILLAIGSIYIGYFFLMEYALQDGAFIGRLEIFNTMEISLKTFFTGNGMVNASDLDRTNTNGGAMEIAWVMLFYKNGVIGVVAFITVILVLLRRIRKINSINQVWAFRGILVAFMVGTLGEAYMVNITNVPSMFNWIILCVLSSRTLNTNKNIKN